MASRFEFDAVNRVLLLRLEGKVTEESAAEFYEAAVSLVHHHTLKLGELCFALLDRRIQLIQATVGSQILS